MSQPELLEPREAYALWAGNYPPHAHNPVMQAEQRAMLALMPPDLRGQRVLDAGCGSGRYVLHALQRGATHVTGVDLSPEMLGRAARELAAHEDRIELMPGDIASLPLPDASVDLTICALAVGHLRELELELSELRRVTRPGGVVLCSDVHPTGHALGWMRDFKSAGGHYAVRHTPHSCDGWRAACARAGLEIERIEEPMLDLADIPHGARFDRKALEVPVALVFRLRRSP
ncbi:MAG TPA: class I SAM-dependent methyltransferase [Rhodanobacteraceae bacterium]